MKNYCTDFETGCTMWYLLSKACKKRLISTGGKLLTPYFPFCTVR